MKLFIIALGLFYAAFSYSQTSENRCLLDKVKSEKNQGVGLLDPPPHPMANRVNRVMANR